MITNNYIYQNLLTRPFIYYHVWVHPAPPPEPIRICYFDHFVNSDPGNIGSYIKAESIFGEYISSQDLVDVNFYVASKPGNTEYYVRTSPQEGYYQTSKIIRDNDVYVKFPTPANSVSVYVRAEPIVGMFVSSKQEVTDTFNSSKINSSRAYTTSRPLISGSYVSSKPGCNPWILRK